MPGDMGVWFGMLSQEEKEAVIKEVGEEAAELFRVKKDAVREAVGLRDLRGADRLEAYRRRGPEIWAQLQQFSDKEYQRQMRDWDRLERRIAFSSPDAAREVTGPISMGQAARASSSFSPEF